MKWPAIILVLATAHKVAMAAPLSPEDAQFFAEKVAPLFEDRCFKCHSHQSGKMKGGLTLDSRSGWAEGGDNGPVVIPGDLEKSMLVRAVRHTDPDLKMPKEKLPDAEIAVLEEWVKRGAPDPREKASPSIAKDDNWWSLRPLPPMTEIRNPKSEIRNPIDGFIRAKLEEKQLAPSPEADRRTLIRRVYVDLTGLPPTPEEVEAFVASSDSQAYEKLVNALLASPHYGERWARHWFDVIHFADTHGFEHDVFRPNAWRFRDYVIESLNRDTPWPRFIREQLAADVFFPDEPRLMAALGYLGAGTYDMSAAGTAPKSFENLDRDDLVTQTMGAFVSTTANCARCHAHKFDPITQEDYYALQAVFAGIGKGDVPYDEDASISQQRKRWKALLVAVNTGNRDVLLAAENEKDVAEWEEARPSLPAWEPLEAETYLSANGATLTRQTDGSILASGPRPDLDTMTLTLTSKLSEVTALRLDLLTDDSLPMKGPGRADNGNLHITEFEVQVFRPGVAQPEKMKIKRASADFDQGGYDVTKTLDGDLKTSWAIHPNVGVPHHAVFELAAKLALEPGAKLLVMLKQMQPGAHLIGHLRLSATNAPASAAFALPAAAETALSIPREQRTPEQRAALAAAILRLRADDELARLPAPVKVWAAGKAAENERGVVAMPSPRVIRLLKRGDVEKPEAEIGPGALSAVTAMPARFDETVAKDESARRAALADWLADPRNPLTWRSIANRVWHFHFGRGLCDTPNDFGHMGGVPSHPELLDWLAANLRDSGGSLKPLHRLIVTSAAYRQSSVHRDEAAKLDPDNRLLWRMNRSRLDADTFRDTVLAVSGRLDLTVGGPGVQHFKSSPGPQSTPVLDYTVFDWDSPGAARRSIYRVVWRGIADPFMDALDFPDMGLLSPVRGFSASPLQSLALLNNEFVLRQSEHFAERVAQSGASTSDQIRTAFRLALLRDPTPEETADFAAVADKHSIPAACRILLNSNEFLFVN
jgi:hypothetical protein